MDILYHGLTGVIISKAFAGSDPAAAAVSAMLPDLAGTMPFYYFKLREALNTPGKPFVRTLYTLLVSNRFANAIDAAAYRSTHSLIAAAVVAVAAYAFFPSSWIIISVSYLSHIVIDIPTHDGDFATRVLYPLSARTFPGANWAKHPALFACFWLILGAIVLWAPFPAVVATAK